MLNNNTTTFDLLLKIENKSEKFGPLKLNYYKQLNYVNHYLQMLKQKRKTGFPC